MIMITNHICVRNCPSSHQPIQPLRQIGTRIVMPIWETIVNAFNIFFSFLFMTITPIPNSFAVLKDCTKNLQIRIYYIINYTKSPQDTSAGSRKIYEKSGYDLSKNHIRFGVIFFCYRYCIN